MLKSDICIIGAGSGGLSIAAGTAQLGLKTILIEKHKMGGDCLNTGCVPSKALLYAGEQGLSFAAAKDHMRSVIAHIEPHDSIERFESLGVNVIQGAGEFIDKHTVTVNGERIQSRYFVIATGSRAAVPPIPGLDRSKIFTNENIFDLNDKPEHLVIIGGGPIGVEMAQLHHALGSRVTVIDLGPILPRDDMELADIIRQKLIGRGITIHEKTTIRAVTHNADGTITVHTSAGDISGSHLLIAAGRTPNVNGIGLEKAGVTFDKRGVKVNGHLRTTNKKIFAVGDVSGSPQFTHVAGYHAGIFIQKAVFKSPFAHVDYATLPWVTYTEPELANAGLTESMAREKYGDDIKILRWSFAENDRAVATNHMNGLIKVILDKKGRILGAGIAGPNAGELIGLWVLAISKAMTVKDIATLIIPYPTLNEVSKRAAGSYYTPLLFSDRTRKIVGLLKNLPV